MSDMKLATTTSSIVISLIAMFGTLLSAADRPNVLFIAIDDLRPKLGCYGETAIHSPSIDKLASSSVMFTRAYCQLAVCNPSRVSIMTGPRPDTTRVWDLRTRFRETIPDAVTLPQHFVKHGYHAVSYGKIFHNPWPDDASWSEPHTWPEKSSLWSSEAKQRLEFHRAKMNSEGIPQQKNCTIYKLIPTNWSMWPRTTRIQRRESDCDSNSVRSCSTAATRDLSKGELTANTLRWKLQQASKEE